MEEHHHRAEGDLPCEVVRCQDQIREGGRGMVVEGREEAQLLLIRHEGHPCLCDALELSVQASLLASFGSVESDALRIVAHLDDLVAEICLVPLQREVHDNEPLANPVGSCCPETRVE